MPAMMHLGEAERRGSHTYSFPRSLLWKKELPSPNLQGKCRSWRSELQCVPTKVCILMTKTQPWVSSECRLCHSTRSHSFPFTENTASSCRMRHGHLSRPGFPIGYRSRRKESQSLLVEGAHRQGQRCCRQRVMSVMLWAGPSPQNTVTSCGDCCRGVCVCVGGHCSPVPAQGWAPLGGLVEPGRRGPTQYPPYHFTAKSGTNVSLHKLS